MVLWTTMVWIQFEVYLESEVEKHIPLDIEHKLNVLCMSYIRLMYVQFTSCVQGDSNKPLYYFALTKRCEKLSFFKIWAISMKQFNKRAYPHISFWYDRQKEENNSLAKFRTLLGNFFRNLNNCRSSQCSITKS